MGLAERLEEAVPRSRNVTSCSICAWYAEQSDRAKELFNAWVDGGGMTSQLYEMCGAEGMPGSYAWLAHCARRHPKARP